MSDVYAILKGDLFLEETKLKIVMQTPTTWPLNISWLTIDHHKQEKISPKAT